MGQVWLPLPPPSHSLFLPSTLKQMSDESNLRKECFILARTLRVESLTVGEGAAAGTTAHIACGHEAETG